MNNYKYIDELENILFEIQSALADYQNVGFEGNDAFYDAICKNITNFEDLMQKRQQEDY